MAPFLSVVVPLYNEELVIGEMYSRLTGVLTGGGLDYEIVMVNDGSRDGTLALAREICARDKRVKLVGFSRNFGHQVAITAGMDRASGQVTVFIDADLQDPPEVILRMIEKWKEGFQVVYGVRARREGESLFKLATASLFYRLLRKITSVEIPVDTGDFRLMDRKVVECVKRMKERSRFLRGMVSWAGFRQCKVEYVREKRFAGETKYPFRKMLKFALDGILSFSQAPLKLSWLFGLLFASVAVVLAGGGLVCGLLSGEAAFPIGSAILVAVLFLGGIQLIAVGILGEYLGRIYEEAKGRPLYLVDEELNFD